MNLFGNRSKGPTANMKAVLKELSQFIKRVPAVVPDAVSIDEESFTLLLSGVSTCRVMPGIPQHMDYVRMYRCDTEENAALARAHLYERYGITDGNSLAAIAPELFHTQEDYEQFESFWSGRPLFRVSELPLREKEYFEGCKDFAERLRPFVSRRGFFAWDCNEKIGLFRKAYACGLIDEESFWRMSIPLAERALTMYGDWKSYGISCLCGAAYFMFCAQNGQGDVLRFVEINRTLLEHMLDKGGVWSRYKWYRSDEDVHEIPDEELPELEMLEEMRGFSEELSQAGGKEEAETGDAEAVEPLVVASLALEEVEISQTDEHPGFQEKSEEKLVDENADGSAPENAAENVESKEETNEEDEIDIGIVIAVEPGYDVGKVEPEKADVADEEYDPLDPVFDRFAGEAPEDEEWP